MLMVFWQVIICLTKFYLGLVVRALSCIDSVVQAINAGVMFVAICTVMSVQYE